MNRLAVSFALAGSLVAQVARAESQAEIAEKENEDGKALMFQGNYKGATEKFRDAADRAPEAKYFFNLCYSVYQQGIFGEALTACNNADKLNPDDTLKGKISKLEDQIKTDAATQHVDLQPAGGGGGPTNEGGGSPDPNNGGGGTTNEGNPTVGGGGPVSTGGPPVQYAVGRPTQNLTTIAPPTHNYTWTLGVDFFGGGGRVGRDNVFGTSSGGVRLKADYMLVPQIKVGLQAYLQIQHFGQGTMGVGSALETLDVFDIGVAAYKHFCGTSRLCLTPLAGIQLSLMSPADDMDGEGSQVFNYAAVGGRLEVALSYALGARLEHVLSLQVGANIYSPVLASPADGSGLGTAGEVGLDTGGAAGYVGLGYTYRFDTPLGQAPFITLE
jgi:tetratricopeptide (TPR) repeat protein